MSFENDFLESVILRFESYKALGDKTLIQLNENEYFARSSESLNSIAMIINHMNGNMLSRWTNFLTEDGEKPWRKRDAEFEDFKCDKEELLKLWEDGWVCMLNTLRGLKAEDLEKTIYIRREPLKAYDAIIRQLMHLSYHVGQIILYAKILKGEDWHALSIPKNKSKEFNAGMGMGI
ncbi:MAG TPA: DUF1572 family protein [Arachidicoccus soli]|nr:DUF1572 family protein [Arachidicoccus soli]